MADWANFFVAEVGASAALAGLVAVAISINLQRILSFPQLPGRAAETLYLLVGVLVLTSVGLIPGQPDWLFGTETLVIGLVMFGRPISLQRNPNANVNAKEQPRFWRFSRAATTAAASLPIVLAGVLILAGSPAGLYLIAVGAILSLLAGVINAWVLLVEILR